MMSHMTELLTVLGLIYVTLQCLAIFSHELCYMFLLVVPEHLLTMINLVVQF